jgi:lipopolysaccharide transport system permease protein
VGRAESVSAAFYGVFGLAIVQTFLEAMNATRRVFANHGQLLRRQNVPLDGLVVAALLDTAFTMAVRLAIIAVAFFVFSVQPVWRTMWVAVAGFVGMAALGAGLGLLVAPLASLKRDVENLFAILPWMLFAVTPVFTPPPAGSLFARLCEYNGLTRIVDGIRAAAYGGHGSPSGAVRGLLAGLLLMLLGWAFCRFAKPYVIERTLA